MTGDDIPTTEQDPHRGRLAPNTVLAAWAIIVAVGFVIALVLIAGGR